MPEPILSADAILSGILFFGLWMTCISIRSTIRDWFFFFFYLDTRFSIHFLREKYLIDESLMHRMKNSIHSSEIHKPRRGFTYDAQRIIINSKIKHICICSACSFHYYFCSFRKHRRWITSVMWFVIALQPWQWRIRTKCDVRRNREIKQFPFVRRRGRRLRSTMCSRLMRTAIESSRITTWSPCCKYLLNQHLVLLWVE